MALVSVLIPTYNRRKMLQPCLTTIRSQTFQDIDIIIYDDGSTDDTKAFVNSIKDDRITYIHSAANNGIIWARNKLLEACQSKYACWQDSDDLANINRIEILKQTIGQRPIIFSGAAILTPKTRWKQKPTTAKGPKRPFATAMFEVAKMPKFVEMIRHPTPTTLGGEDTVWRAAIHAKYGPSPLIQQELYYIRRHGQRIGKWRQNRELNPVWYDKMMKRAHKPK